MIQTIGKKRWSPGDKVYGRTSKRRYSEVVITCDPSGRYFRKNYISIEGNEKDIYVDCYFVKVCKYKYKTWLPATCLFKKPSPKNKAVDAVIEDDNSMDEDEQSATDNDDDVGNIDENKDIAETSVVPVKHKNYRLEEKLKPRKAKVQAKEEISRTVVKKRVRSVKVEETVIHEQKEEPTKDRSDEPSSENVNDSESDESDLESNESDSESNESDSESNESDSESNRSIPESDEGDLESNYENDADTSDEYKSNSNEEDESKSKKVKEENKDEDFFPLEFDIFMDIGKDQILGECCCLKNCIRNQSDIVSQMRKQPDYFDYKFICCSSEQEPFTDRDVDRFLFSSWISLRDEENETSSEDDSDDSDVSNDSVHSDEIIQAEDSDEALDEEYVGALMAPKCEFQSTNSATSSKLPRPKDNSVLHPVKMIHIDWCFVCGQQKNLTDCSECCAAYHASCAAEAIKNIPDTFQGRTRLSAICFTSRIANVQSDCPACKGPKPSNGDMVWHKLKGCPWWPARVLGPHELPLCLGESPSLLHFPVRYYAAENYAWAHIRHFCRFTLEHVKNIEEIKPKLLQQGCTEASEDFICYYLG